MIFRPAGLLPEKHRKLELQKVDEHVVPLDEPPSETPPPTHA